MRNKILLNVALICACSLNALGWGQKGHDTTAYIAEQHLTDATKAAIDSILEGKSIVYWSNWLDNASHTPEYAYTKTWHYKNVDEGERYEEAQANPAGDAVTAIKAQVELLTGKTGKTPTLEESQLALKILVHVMGDLHMPLHMGHATDLGGNRVKVKYFGREANLHSIWDSSIPESAHKWSYSEWQQQIDRGDKALEAKIIKGNVDYWAKETISLASRVYDYFPEGKNVSYNEVAEWAPVVEDQFLRGGIRLAHVLNQIFDPKYK